MNPEQRSSFKGEVKGEVKNGGFSTFKGKSKKLVEALRGDVDIAPLISKSKKIRVHYKLKRKELEKFITGAIAKRMQSETDFEKSIEHMYRIQAYMDRLLEMRTELRRYKRLILDLYQTGSVYLSSFDHVQKVRTASQRDEWVDEILLPISKKRTQIEELLDIIEDTMWNLKHSFQVVQSQVDVSKSLWYMSNPERNLKGGLKGNYQ